MSTDGVSWLSFGNVTVDVPTNGYTDLSSPYSDTPGNVLSDFQQPFDGGLSSFDGLVYSDSSHFDILDRLAGSGGGKWLDISSLGITQAGFIRISVPDDGNPSTNQNFELDAVAVSHAALGTITAPEPATAAGVVAMFALLAISRRTRCLLLS